jgi:hypothetical protein
VVEVVYGAKAMNNIMNSNFIKVIVGLKAYIIYIIHKFFKEIKNHFIDY